MLQAVMTCLQNRVEKFREKHPKHIYFCLLEKVKIFCGRSGRFGKYLKGQGNAREFEN